MKCTRCKNEATAYVTSTEANYYAGGSERYVCKDHESTVVSWMQKDLRERGAEPGVEVVSITS